MTGQRVVLVNGPARQDRSYPMPELPEGIDDPPTFLYLEKAAERGGDLRVSSARLISDLYQLMRERDDSPSREGENLVYAHIPEDKWDSYAEGELEQRRQWCTHPWSVVIKREAPGAAPGVRYCGDCKQRVHQP